MKKMVSVLGVFLTLTFLGVSLIDKKLVPTGICDLP